MRPALSTKRRFFVLLALGAWGLACSLAYPLGGYEGAPDASSLTEGTDGAVDAPSQDAAAPTDGDAGSGYAAVVLADAPAAYYRFEETVPGLAFDSSGHGRDGTYLGGVTLQLPGAVANEASHSVHLNGTNAYVRIGAVLQFAGKAPMSLEAWVKPDLLDATYRGIISNENALVGSNRRGYLLWSHTGPEGLGFERLGTDGGKGFVGDAVASAPLDVTTWSHVVIAFDGTLMVTYVNAQEVERAPASAVQDVPDGALVIGSRASGALDYFAGRLDEVAIYEKALSPARVAAHYTAGKGK